MKKIMNFLYFLNRAAIARVKDCFLNSILVNSNEASTV
jgi:hypothetical protein